ncbi:MAG TPA: hypothetical protein VKO61_00910 [Candidatus Paceibacterota bacterium]|nr:hypothetical protein [Candidatus Paceibacterota bacterium]
MKTKENKVFLDPDDGLEDVIKKIKKNKHDQITLHIPQGSVLKSSLDNFHTIQREAVLAEKEILIESVNKYIEELAERAGLKAINPIFGREEKLVSDIIPRDSKKSVNKSKDFNDKELSKSKEEKAKTFFNTPRKKKNKSKKQKKSKKSLSPVNKKKRALVTTGVFLLLIAFGFLSAHILPKADITLTLKKNTIDFVEKVKASSSVYETSVKNNQIILPGEILTASQNIEKKFPASGEKKIEEKAHGEIYIYNEFSSSPQVLVATTRFVSPGGKVFRLDERTTVPGAKIVDGGIEPSKIKVSVTASKPGEEYNINPDFDTKWTIPGFKEAGLMKRYEGFYGKPATKMSEGYSGVAKTPTEQDIKNAKEEISKTLQNSLEKQAVVANSDEFKILKAAKEFKINEIDISKKADEDGNFSVFAEGHIKIFVFKEGVLKEALVKKNDSSVNFNFNITKDQLTYKEESPDWENNQLSFTAEGSFVLKPKINEKNLKAQLVGQAESVIKSIIFSVPGLERAKVSLWPFWVNKVPENPNKVNIKLK